MATTSNRYINITLPAVNCGWYPEHHSFVIDLKNRTITCARCGWGTAITEGNLYDILTQYYNTALKNNSVEARMRMLQEYNDMAMKIAIYKLFH